MTNRLNFTVIVSILVISMLLLASCVSVVREPTGDEVADTDEDVSADEEADADETADEEEEQADEEADEDAEEDVEEDTAEVADEEEAEEEVDEEADADNPTKTVIEGELVSFPNLRATDPDGDPITYTFTAPLDSEGVWQTEPGDMGEYDVTITASDGVNVVSQDVRIIVKSSNLEPIITGLEDIEVNEGKTVTLVFTVKDPEGSDVDVEISGWMENKTKETTYADAGEYEVTVTASDELNSVSETITVLVNDVNRAPDLEGIEDITVQEGDKVTTAITAVDPDGDNVLLTFSSPLDSTGKWETQVGDKGKYRVSVTASDGTRQTKRSFFVVVTSANDAPVIEGVTDISAKEGDVITLGIEVTDAEGDNLTITYPAQFDENGVWETGFDDAGTYNMNVKANDGETTVKESFVVVIENVNRPPSFGDDSFT